MLKSWILESWNLWRRLENKSLKETLKFEWKIKDWKIETWNSEILNKILEIEVWKENLVECWKVEFWNFEISDERSGIKAWKEHWNLSEKLKIERLKLETRES